MEASVPVLPAADMVTMQRNFYKLCQTFMPALDVGMGPSVFVEPQTDGKIGITIDCNWEAISLNERGQYSNMLASFMLGAGWGKHQQTYGAKDGPVLIPNLGAPKILFSNIEHLVLAANAVADIVRGPKITIPGMQGPSFNFGRAH